MKLTFAKLLAAVLVLWLAAPIVLWFVFSDLGSRGQFGDLFGSVNALFSGLAFAGLFWALRVQQEQLALQREELKLQREELRMQREEMTASRQELANQVKAQVALVLATTAQVTVASVQAEIEALKLEAEELNRGGRSTQINQIRARAQALSSLANRLEGGEVSVA
jgi:cell shape-determining protein MreC